jgi:hypothetical protein
MYLINALRVLSLSLGNGVGMMDSLHASKYVVDNRLFQDFIGHVEDQVETGNGVAAGFRGTGFIPPIVEQMISTAPRGAGNAAGYGRGGRNNRQFADFADFQADPRGRVKCEKIQLNMLIESRF